MFAGEHAFILIEFTDVRHIYLLSLPPYGNAFHFISALHAAFYVVCFHPFIHLCLLVSPLLCVYSELNKFSFWWKKDADHWWRVQQARKIQNFLSLIWLLYSDTQVGKKYMFSPQGNLAFKSPWGAWSYLAVCWMGTSRPAAGKQAGPLILHSLNTGRVADKWEQPKAVVIAGVHTL